MANARIKLMYGEIEVELLDPRYSEWVMVKRLSGRWFDPAGYGYTERVVQPKYLTIEWGE
jgi:hypothetical protein